MADFLYLWTNRAKFSIITVAFYKAWIKRIYCFPEVMNRNFNRFILISGGAMIHETAEISKMKIQGSKRLLSVGSFSFVGQVYIALHEQIKIGERVCINDGVEMLTASHDVSDPKWSNTKASITIEDYAWIGTGAMLLPGVNIGRGAVVGARAVVSKSVMPGAIVVGNPAKQINKIRSKELNYNPCDSLASNRAWLRG
ncbi:acyltransferase [Rufibacter sp. XAAS-G3-1]|uniref:acyltransferase n=1 Tax=Rufibacter sp. XAAS-G3-1 TaxID=2729134 RepID=UPI0015E76CBA|nr:acyltransferase [Rufibacter sp. XAAS-G3-1]